MSFAARATPIHEIPKQSGIKTKDVCLWYAAFQALKNVTVDIHIEERLEPGVPETKVAGNDRVLLIQIVDGGWCSAGGCRNHPKIPFT